MRVIVSAGGTGGHIYPALAIIKKIQEEEPDSEILYIGTTDRMEADIIPKMGYTYVGLEIKGLNRHRPKFKWGLRMLTNFKQRIIKYFL